MLNSNQAFMLIEKIAAIGSTNEKKNILSSNSAETMLRDVIEYSVNPTKIYGIIPDTSWINKSDSTQCFREETFKLLDDLIERKITGHDARDAIISELNVLSNESAELLIRIIRKDLRAGFSVASTNKTWPNLIPEFPYMRCSSPKNVDFANWDFKTGVYCQLKSDGLYANGNVDQLFTLITRAGSLFPMDEFGEIAEIVKVAKGHQLQGELLVTENGVILKREIGNGILNSISSGGKFEKGQKPLYVVWDIIPLSECKKKNKYRVPYSQRIAKLETMFADNEYVKVCEYKVLHSMQSCYEETARLIKDGHEGSVCKKHDAIWEDGTSKNQVKLKVEFDCDLVIKEILPGKVNTKNEGRPGALRCESSDGLLKVSITVKNDKMRDIIEKDPSDWIDRVVTIISNDITTPSEDDKPFSLFLPRLIEDVYRADKTEADDLQKIKDALASVISGASFK